MYKLYRVGAKTEHCACIFRGVDISHSTVTFNFLLERKKLLRLIMLAEKLNLETLCN
jgi:hypothetical protein